MARLSLRFPFKLLKPYTPKGLFGRTALILLIPLLLVAGVSTFVFFDRTWNSTTRRFALDLSGQISSLVTLHKAQKLTEKELIQHARKHYGFKVALLNKAFFKQAPRSRKGLGFRIFYAALGSQLNEPIKVYVGKVVTHVHVLIADQVLSVDFPTKWLLNKTTTVFVVWQLLTPILFFFVALIFLRNQVRPLRYLSEKMDSFGKGQNVGPLRAVGASEVRQATRAFNIMQERLARLVMRRMEMLAGISHDLRTPLTRLELELAIMEKKQDVSSLRADVKEMTNMVEAFLAFAKGQDSEKTQNVPLKALITDALFPIHAKWTVNCSDDLVIAVRRLATKRCLSNIFRNADRFADSIEVTVQYSKNWLMVQIDDDGPGIPKDKRKDAFRPFYRLDASRNLDDGGVGLGLSISRDIVNQHGGKISLHDSPLGGLRVIIRLPR